MKSAELRGALGPLELVIRIKFVKGSQATVTPLKVQDLHGNNPNPYRQRFSMPEAPAAAEE